MRRSFIYCARENLSKSLIRNSLKTFILLLKEERKTNKRSEILRQIILQHHQHRRHTQFILAMPL
jgi:hypothetical protein